MQFNVSHSSGLVVVALAGGSRIGVDVESLDRIVDPLAVAARFFAPQEIELLIRADDVCRHKLFLRIWVLKEALLKGLGVGIGGMPLSDFAVEPRAGEAAAVLPLTDMAKAAVSGWTIAEIPLLGRYVAAIAIEGPVNRVHLLDWPTSARWPF